jgi:predicted HTH transcriptional regulator
MVAKVTQAPSSIIALNSIQGRIFTIRGVQVMVDRDLASVYEVGTKVLNQAVKRNLERFPDVFRFQLSDDEKNELVTNCDRFESLKHATTTPYVFTKRKKAVSATLYTKNFSKELALDLGRYNQQYPSNDPSNDRSIGGPIEKSGGPIGGPIDLTERQKFILTLIQEDPKISKGSLAAELKINRSAAQKHLEALSDKGAITRIGGTRGHWQVNLKKEN